MGYRGGDEGQQRVIHKAWTMRSDQASSAVSQVTLNISPTLVPHLKGIGVSHLPHGAIIKIKRDDVYILTQSESLINVSFLVLFPALSLS